MTKETIDTKKLERGEINDSSRRKDFATTPQKVERGSIVVIPGKKTKERG